jgi:uncharacterized protein YgbK (DUF1537 family)
MEVFVLGLVTAEAMGMRFLYRTAASFVAVRAGILRRSLLTRAELAVDDAAGVLFVVGSHVPRSTAQLEHLLGQGAAAGVEVSVPSVLANGADEEIARVAAAADAALAAGRSAVVYTSRKVAVGASPEESLALSGRVSDALVRIVRAIRTRPRLLVGKGGITSSDLATEALGIRHTLVLGQILPGVPVWRMGDESRHPGLSYVVFPGNVGAEDALALIAGMAE